MAEGSGVDPDQRDSRLKDNPRNTADKVDRDLLHEFLFNKADRSGRITMTQIEIAELIGIGNTHLSRIYKEFKAEGRIRRIGTHYYIEDPAKWAWTSRMPMNRLKDV